MVDFINEVEEELRKDEYNRLLKKFGPLLVGIVIAIVAATAFMEWKKSSADKAARATSYAYVQAGKVASDGNNEEAIQQFVAISEKAPSGYAGLSLMRASAIELRSGDRAQAVAYLDRAAQLFEKPRHKQLAQIKAAYILTGEGRFEDVRSRLGALAQSDQPYEDLARELLGFAAMQTDDMSAAREQFSYLGSIPGVTDTVASRAKQYLSLMAVDAAANAPAPTDATSADDTVEAVLGQENTDEDKTDE